MRNFILICLCSIPVFAIARSPMLDTVLHENTGVEVRNKDFLSSKIESGQLYLHIPKSILGTTILWTRKGLDNQYLYKQVVFTVSRDQIILEEHRIWSEMGIWIPLEEDASLKKNVLAIFPISNERRDTGGYWIDITGFLLEKTVMWTPGFGETLYPNLSYIEDRADMEGQVIIKTLRGMLKKGNRLSEPVYYSFYALPDPMKPRRFDYRMGFFSDRIPDFSYGTKNGKASIQRWHLEKKHKNQNISVPVRPITFVMSPEIPKRWRSYVKAGIEAWQPAFESAGFKDALVVEEVDTLNDWDRNGLQNSIISWGTVRHVRGSGDRGRGSSAIRVIDLRSGEIIKSDIVLGTSLQNLMDDYFIRCAPLDKRAQKFPFPDDLIGELIQYLVAHEAGHAFGLMDGNYGEYSYPFDRMGDGQWLQAMGHTPSIMNYARHNNIAQPEDGVPASLLVQKVGPTDVYSIKWAYMEFMDGVLPEAQDDELMEIIHWQDSVPWYRYIQGQNEIIGPGATDEVVETDNPVKSTEMALKNMKRVVELLPSIHKGQKDNARLERLYDKTLELWYRQMRQVVSIVGGYDIYLHPFHEKHGMYTPIDLEQQYEAIDFVLVNAFCPPDWLTYPSFVSRINHSTYPDKVLAYQQRLVLELLRPQRMKRFEHLEKIRGNEETLKEYLKRLQSGLFKELRDDKGKVEPRNQEIQMTYINRLIWAIQQESEDFSAHKKVADYTAYTKGLMLERLMALKKDIEKRLSQRKTMDSLGHWKLCMAKLDVLSEI
ncbi:zinc-dependent metalloprotease [Flagellimonas marinaquae]|nr:zinc-dependent metalloprotease [Allomuricauda aquimarina]